MEPRDYYGWSRCFALFRGLEADPVIAAFYELLKEPSPQSYAVFVSRLYGAGQVSWSAYLSQAVLGLENGCTRIACAGKSVPDVMLVAAKTELHVLSEMAMLSPDFFDVYGYKAGYLVSEGVDLYPLWLEHLKQAGVHGFGDFAKYRMFRFEAGSLLPVVNPDPVRLSDLIGYELQKESLVKNTRALLNGFPASNVLLYGDAGTGKSASVKAVVNEFWQDGLRLIELDRANLPALPGLLDLLAENPLKFVIFIDDLSFQENDESFGALKAVLEGSAAARRHNTVIYATSNRRHLVRETFQARQGDEVHRNDTLQETVSLSERFGLRLLYERPNKDLYLRIVKGLAQKNGVSEDGLVKLAEQFALGRAGRSGRAARQLVEQLAAQKEEQAC